MRFLIFLSCLLTGVSVYGQEVIDKIAAVVGDEIITQSELEFQVNIFAAQRRVDATTPGLKNQVLNVLIEEKLVYTQANLDSITVTDDEVKSRIDYQLEVFKQQHGSLAKVEEVYGMSVEKIRRELQDGVRKNIMVQKLQEKNFSDVETSRREVEDFFNLFKDSLGVIPEKVQIAHIFRNPRKSETIKLKFKKFAESLLDSIKNGADFAALAKQYSEDPGSASQGGDLGFVKRGVFYPEFESVAFALNENEISNVIESPVGFHIVQLLEKRGESIHTRHILIKIKNDEEADLNTIQFLSDIRDSIIHGKGQFSYYAKKYSEDEDTKKFGGELGTFYINQLDKAFLDAVAQLKENEISFPRRFEYSADNYGYHIVYLRERIAQHKADLKMDYDELKRLADEYKKQKLYEKWIAELKDNIFWEIRI